METVFPVATMRDRPLPGPSIFHPDNARLSERSITVDQSLVRDARSEALIQQARAVLPAAYVYDTAEYLRTQSPVLDATVAIVTQRAIATYQARSSAQSPVDSATDPIQPLIRDFFDTQGLWETIAQDIWAYLLSWAVEDIRASMERSQFETSPDAELLDLLNQRLCDRESTTLYDRIHFLETFYARHLGNVIVHELDFPNYPIEGLEALLGLRRDEIAPSTEMKLSQIDTIAAIPTGLPIVSSISAQLQKDLWKPNDQGLAHFRYNSKTNSANYLEHYITTPGDIEVLPWEAAEQIIQKFGFNTVKLQFIFAAHAMRQAKPWESTFTLKASDLIAELGWDKNHGSSLAQKRNEVASIAYALSCLLVKAVWTEGRGKQTLDVSTPTGRMWEILIDPRGQLNWQTGRIEKPDEVYITVRPGLWTAHFLNQAGNKAKEALYQFGYLALNILKLDPYHDELTLRLAIHLTLDVRIRARDRSPYEYRVRTLLEAALPLTAIQEARTSSEKARGLFSRWNHALATLASLGWTSISESETWKDHPHFYCEPYPEWLAIETTAKKPRGWMDQWLEQKLLIKPPNPIPERMASLSGGKKRAPHIPKSAALPILNGAQVKAFRQQRGWTQAKLAGMIGVHQSLIAKIESGDRPISADLESDLRGLMNRSS